MSQIAFVLDHGTLTDEDRVYRIANESPTGDFRNALKVAIGPEGKRLTQYWAEDLATPQAGPPGTDPLRQPRHQAKAARKRLGIGISVVLGITSWGVCILVLPHYMNPIRRAILATPPVEILEIRWCDIPWIRANSLIVSPPWSRARTMAGVRESGEIVRGYSPCAGENSEVAAD